MSPNFNPLNPPYWQYYLAIEDDLLSCSRFVEFTSENFSVYSIEFAKLLLASSSEIDVVAKDFRKLLSPTARCDNIADYRTIILANYPLFSEFEVRIPRFSISTKPWRDWSQGESPTWWKAYNKVKHNRSEHYSQANLANVIDALAALFTLLLYYCRQLQSVDSDGRVQIYLNPPPELCASSKYLNPDVHTHLWAFDFPDKYITGGAP